MTWPIVAPVTPPPPSLPLAAKRKMSKYIVENPFTRPLYRILGTKQQHGPRWSLDVDTVHDSPSASHVELARQRCLRRRAGITTHVLSKAPWCVCPAHRQHRFATLFFFFLSYISSPLAATLPLPPFQLSSEEMVSMRDRCNTRNTNAE